MAEIRAFKGVHFNKALVGDVSAVICPPYDIISPEMRDELYRRSQYNFVRLEFAPDLTGDTASDNKYTRSADALEQWLKQGVLKVDDRPAIYLHDQYFTHEGKKYRRRGMIVTVRLEEWSKRVVRPHENTMSGPKSDRLKLLWALQVNTSPVFGLFEDRGQQVASLLAEQDKAEPMLDITMDGERHRVWAVHEGGVVQQLCGLLADQPLYIADGHHRYESALNYRNERRACSGSTSTNEPYDSVMMTLVDFADPGLVILPTHRLLRGLPEAIISGLLPRLKDWFEVEQVPLDTSSVGGQLDGIWAKEETDHPQLVMFGPEKGHLHVLRLRDFALAARTMPPSHTEVYKRLNVSVLDHLILETLLGLGRDNEAGFLTYNHDRQDAVGRVVAGEYQVAFLLSPIKGGVIKSIADAADRMPRKSTYFYPKLPSGLVLHRLA